jgi:hypothetical protein
MIRSISAALLALVATSGGLVAGAGCDSGGGGGPSTKCQIPVGTEDPTKLSFGERCTTDQECAFGTCLMPGEPGNITNTKFGFCTRGCDCGDDEASSLTEEEKEEYVCLYTPSPDQHRRHVVLRCDTGGVASCTAVDAEYNTCKADYGVRKYCQAL